MLNVNGNGKQWRFLPSLCRWLGQQQQTNRIEQQFLEFNYKVIQPRYVKRNDKMNEFRQTIVRVSSIKVSFYNLPMCMRMEKVFELCLDWSAWNIRNCSSILKHQFCFVSVADMVSLYYITFDRFGETWDALHVTRFIGFVYVESIWHWMCTVQSLCYVTPHCQARNIQRRMTCNSHMVAIVISIVELSFDCVSLLFFVLNGFGRYWKRWIEKESKRTPYYTELFHTHCDFNWIAYDFRAPLLYVIAWNAIRSSLTSADARYAEWSIHHNKQYNNSVEHWLPVCVDVTTTVSDIRQNNVNLFFTFRLESGQSANAKKTRFF